MNYTISIQRSRQGSRAAWKSYLLEVPEETTVLDALFAIRQQQDATLAFRCSCRVGMCGTCALRINGVAGLACKTRLSALKSQQVALTPLPHFPVIRDLAVALDPFFEQWRRIGPAFRPQNPEATELARIPAGSQYAQLTPGKRDCITCGACYAACSIPEMNKRYLGPAAINKALLRILDPRDAAHKQRLDVVNDLHTGVWRCHTQFTCGEVCPKGINLTHSITLLKRGVVRDQAESNA